MISYAQGLLRGSFRILPDVAELRQLLEAGRMVLTQARLRETAHVHDAGRIEIIYVGSGRQRYRVAGRLHEVRGGDVLVVLPNESHAKAAGGVEERGIIYYAVLDLPAAGKRLLDLTPVESTAMRAALLGLRRHFRGCKSLPHHIDLMAKACPCVPHDPLALLAMRNHLLAFLLDVIHCSGLHPTSKGSGRMAKVLALVDEQHDTPLPVGEMARVAGLSLSHFKSAFKAQIGLPPADYVRQRRVTMARAMLLETPGRSITEVALEFGFSSSQNFATTFKHYVGMSPRRFRAQAELSRRQRSSLRTATSSPANDANSRF